MKALFLMCLTLLISGCSTHSSTPWSPSYKFIPIEEGSDLEWNDKFDSDAWRVKFKRCQEFLYEENDSWNGCMDNDSESVVEVV